jgi:hypothetical protein
LAQLRPLDEAQLSAARAIQEKAKDRVVSVVLDEVLKGNFRPRSSDTRSDLFDYYVGLVKGAMDLKKKIEGAEGIGSVMLDEDQIKTVRQLKTRVQEQEVNRILEQVLEQSQKGK